MVKKQWFCTKEQPDPRGPNRYGPYDNQEDAWIARHHMPRHEKWNVTSEQLNDTPAATDDAAKP